MSTISINLDRLEKALKLFRMDQKKFISLLNERSKNKTPIAGEEIFTPEIKISHLKKIDKILDMGLPFYTDPAPIPDASSVFFRKPKFQLSPQPADIRAVKKMEERKHHLSALAKLSRLNTSRKLKIYTLDSDARKVAEEMRATLYPRKPRKQDKDFLVQMIDILGDQNVLVMEFVDRAKKEKTVLDGFFISPNVIAVKRNGNNFKREIFTLCHELGHYLLGSEEINPPLLDNSISGIEKWCNKFAFHFLIGDASELLGLDEEEIHHRNTLIWRLSTDRHLSRLAIFYFLREQGRIDWERYFALKRDLEEEHQETVRLEKITREQKTNEAGEVPFISTPRPVISNYEKRIYTYAYLEGVIDEHEVLDALHTKKNIDEIIYE